MKSTHADFELVRQAALCFQNLKRLLHSLGNEWSNPAPEPSGELPVSSLPAMLFKPLPSAWLFP